MPAYKDHNAEFIINSRVIESCGLRQAVVQECQREWAKTPLEVTEPTPRQLICGAIALVPEIAVAAATDCVRAAATAIVRSATATAWYRRI